MSEPNETCPVCRELVTKLVSFDDVEGAGAILICEACHAELTKTKN